MIKKTKLLNIRVDTNMDNDLNEIADILGFGKAQFTRMIIKNGLTYFKKKINAQITDNNKTNTLTYNKDTENEINALLETMKHLK